MYKKWNLFTCLKSKQFKIKNTQLNCTLYKFTICQITNVLECNIHISIHNLYVHVKAHSHKTC